MNNGEPRRWSRGSDERGNKEERTLLPSSDPPNSVIARVRYLLTSPSHRQNSDSQDLSNINSLHQL